LAVPLICLYARDVLFPHVFLQVIYLFAVLGTMMFGRNDPANFGTVSIAMMTLFCMSTLTWSDVAYVQYHGCNVFDGGALRSVEGMGRRKSSIEALVA
jgi:hypothetical protein